MKTLFYYDAEALAAAKESGKGFYASTADDRSGLDTSDSAAHLCWSGEVCAYRTDDGDIFAYWDTLPATLEAFADRINECDEWMPEFNTAITLNGWKDLTGSEWGICSDGKNKLMLNDEGKAIIVAAE